MEQVLWIMFHLILTDYITFQIIISQSLITCSNQIFRPFHSVLVNRVFKILASLELLYREIKPNSEPSVDLTCVKVCLQDTTFTSCSAFNKDTSLPTHISQEEIESLSISKNENKLVIQKASK